MSLMEKPTPLVHDHISNMDMDFPTLPVLPGKEKPHE